MVSLRVTLFEILIALTFFDGNDYLFSTFLRCTVLIFSYVFNKINLYKKISKNAILSI